MGNTVHSGYIILLFFFLVGHVYLSGEQSFMYEIIHILAGHIYLRFMMYKLL